MKNLIPVLLLFTLLLGSCADTPLISADALKPSLITAKHHHEPVKKGACADPQAPLLSQCSATVSATFDSQGALWIAWVNNKHLYIQSSKDKGKSFSAPHAD